MNPNVMKHLFLIALLLLMSPAKADARNITDKCQLTNRDGLIEVGYTAEQIDDFTRGCQDFVDGMIAATEQSDAYYVGYEYAANRYAQ